MSDDYVNPEVLAKLKKLSYDPKVIHPAKHHNLVLNLEAWTSSSNIPVEYVLQDSSIHLSELEMETYDEWFRLRNFGGLLYEGEYDPSALIRMRAMGGAFMRSYNDARILHVQDLLDQLLHGERTQVMNLMVPDFQHPSLDMEQYQYDLLTRYLRDRFYNHKFTAIACMGGADLLRVYGDDMADLVKNYYRRVKA